jgi:hypothetical protein
MTTDKQNLEEISFQPIIGGIYNGIKSLFKSGSDDAAKYASSQIGGLIQRLSKTKNFAVGKGFTLDIIRKSNEYKKSLMTLGEDFAQKTYRKPYSALTDAEKKLVIEKSTKNLDDVISKNLKLTSQTLASGAEKRGADLVRIGNRTKQAQKAINSLSNQNQKIIKKLIGDNLTLVGDASEGAKILNKIKSKEITIVKNGEFYKISRNNLANQNAKIFTISRKTVGTIAKYGLSATAIIGLVSAMYPNILISLFDENGNNLDDNSSTNVQENTFPACVQELINSGEGEITKLKDGSSAVYYKENNIYFYTNGRVYDVTSKKFGTYKCKGTQIAESKSKKLTLHNILNEVIGIIDNNTLVNDVNKVISYLRGLYVSQSDLGKTTNILKKYIATNQGKQFLDLYQRSGYTKGTLRDRADAVFASDAGTVMKKDELMNLINSIETGTATATTPGEKKGLGGIDITWDGASASTPTPAPEAKRTSGGQPNYFDCSQKDFPYQYGCISPRIAEIQTCMGITPNKGYFGPKTRREIGIDRDVITKELYDSIMANCAGKSSVNSDAIKQATMDTSKKELDAKGIGKFKPSSVQRPSYVDYNEPAYNPNVQPNEAD